MLTFLVFMITVSITGTFIQLISSDFLFELNILRLTTVYKLTIHGVSFECPSLHVASMWDVLS